MKKLIYIGITFPICAVFGMWKIWLGFTIAFLIFARKRNEKSALWEIPMGVLACSILADMAGDSLSDAIKIIIPVSSVIVAFLFPRRLPMFFILAATALFLKDVYALSAMIGVLWSGIGEIIIKRQVYLDYSTIKRKLLQGNNSAERKNV